MKPYLGFSAKRKQPSAGLLPCSLARDQGAYSLCPIRGVARGQSGTAIALLDIGRLIDQRPQGETWGRAIVENLAKNLRAELPGVGGFSAANLWRIKQFHEAYSKDEKLAPLVREVSWTKNLVILDRCKDSAERQFYLERTKQFGWTKNVLIHQIAFTER